MKLFISFSARETGNCAQIIDFMKAQQDKVIYYKDLNTHGCSNCGYECFKTQCRYRDDDVYSLYSSFAGYEKVILLVPMYCGNPSSLYFSFNERSQDFFMHHEDEYISFAERLYIIGVYGSNEESPDFTRCFEKWFEGTPYTHHVLGIERHLYRQTINDSVIDVEAIKTALHKFIFNHMLEKMDKFFEARLPDYDHHMLTTIEGAKEFYPYTASQLPQTPEAHILDLGCGTGIELEHYFPLNPTAHITGIDLSKAMLEALAAKFPHKNLTLIQASYFDTDLGEEQYHAAVSVESLHHFTSDLKLSLYQKLHRSLKPKGYFILTDYFAESEALEKEYFSNFENLKREQGITDNAFYHYDTPLTVEHEVETLKKAGFSRAEILKSWGATCTIIAER